MKHDNKKNVIKVIGIDLAKNSFHIHGVNQAGYKVMSKKENESATNQALYGELANLPCSYGGLWWSPLLGAFVQSIWPSGEANSASICQAICSI